MTQFRPPAVPLTTFDPYTSIWCTADRLTDDWPRHWTGTKMALYAVVRVDGTAYRVMGGPEWLTRAGEQVSCRVFATRSEYRFGCGGIELQLDFITPLLLDDLDLLARPASYLRFRVRARDGVPHNVQVYLDMTGEIAVNLPHERVYWDIHVDEVLTALSFRSEGQRILAESGDHRRIDWGTAYLVGRTGRVEACVGDIDICRDSFVTTGRPSAKGLKPAPRKVDYNSEAVLAVCFDLDVVIGATAEETILVAYDDEWSVEYFGTWLRPWWRRHSETTPLRMLEKVYQEEDAVLARADAFDRELTARGLAAGGADYATLLSLVWRHSIAAHKLVAGPDGTPLFLSKENFSNGCIGTVDVAYPSAPLFLAYNPALIRAMLNPYFSYCASGAWPFRFAAHDLGTYPKANGQTYRGFSENPGQPILETQMPIEECGNMLILVAAVVEAEGSADYARRNWRLLTQWADYLVDTGYDPGLQLCTDDFAGVLGHSVNLSAKATMALGCYAKLASKLGYIEQGRAYRRIAERFAAALVREAQGDAGTRLAFDQPDSWSLKYNLVWDRLLGLELFSASELQREQESYRARMQTFGVPLDSRGLLSKPEWMLWAASLTEDDALFRDLCGRLVRYADQTPNRVPMADLFFVDNGRKIGFQARSVLGGLFVGLLKGWDH